MSRLILWPPSGSSAAANPANGTPGSTAPTTATEVAGVDAGGVLRALKTDTTGSLLAPSIDATGTMSNTGDQCCVTTTNGVATVAVQTTGTWSGLLVLQGSVDGTNWGNLPLYDDGSRSVQQYMTYNSLYVASVGGNTQVRVYATNLGAGPVNIRLHGNMGIGPNTVVSASSDAFFATVNLRDGYGQQISSSGGKLAVQDAALETSAASIDSKTPTLGQKTSANSAPVVLASDQTPFADKTVTGTVTNGNDTVTISTAGYATVRAQVSGTWTGFIATEGTVNGTDWAALNIYDGLGSNSAPAPGIGGNGVRLFNTGGFSAVRFRLSNPGSGTANITMIATVSSAAPYIVSGGSSQVAVNATQAGTWTVAQGTAGASAWKVDGSAVTQPISAAALPLPAGAATAANQTSSIGPVAPGTAATNSQLVAAVYNTTVPTPTNGQQVALQADQYSNLAAVNPDLLLTGAAAQTATVNNILPAASGAAATNAANYRSASVQVVSTGTGGTYIFEGSNDNVNFQPMTVYNQAVLTGTPITAAITASASQSIYTFPITAQYIRLRIATTITGGSIQAFSRVSQASWTPPVFQVAQGTAANLATTSTIASGTITTVSTVTAANLNIPGIIADVASAAITTTTTTATLTPTYGTSYSVNIPVTAVSGTAPTLQITVQESADTGTNWYNVYSFPVITTTGSYNSPVITLTGNRVRYVQTVTGTTPSFTRAINRLQSSQGNLPQVRSTANVPVYNAYTTTSITTAAYTQLVASTTSSATLVDIFDSSGQSMILAVGPAGSEVIQAYIAPGGEQLPLTIPAGSRIAYKALTASATAGYLTINLLT